MTLIEQIKKDLEVGTPGALSICASPDIINRAIRLHGGKAIAADIRRKLRTQEMETALLAAEELARLLVIYRKHVRPGFPFDDVHDQTDTALSAYRAAMETDR